MFVLFFIVHVNVASAELIELSEGRTMGTTYHVKLVTSTNVDRMALETHIADLLANVNRQMSTYDPQSEISRFNTLRSTEWFTVSRETALVTDRALEMSEISSNAFTPTIGPLVRLWGFGPDPQQRRVPSEEDLNTLQSRVCCQLVEVELDPPALKKLDPQVELDLSAIAKGYGVDVVSEWLATQPGISAHMVEIGGEVRVRGRKSADVPWRLAIERPTDFAREQGYVIELQDEALATSGDYRNYFEVDGVRYSHTIDPQTGYPITHNLASVSVISSDCMTADALATALNVLGPVKGLKLAEAENIAAFFVVRGEAGFEEFSSTAARERFQEIASAPAAESSWVIVAITVGVFALAMCGLGAGVIISNRRLKGTCGGLQGLKDANGQSACEMCSTPDEDCESFRNKAAQAMKGSSEI